MSNLNETILSKCRDQVARSKRNHPIANSRFENFEEMQTQLEKNGFGNMLILAHEEAALMAMEELSRFLAWWRGGREWIYPMDPHREYAKFLNEEYGRGKW